MNNFLAYYMVIRAVLIALFVPLIKKKLRFDVFSLRIETRRDVTFLPLLSPKTHVKGRTRENIPRIEHALQCYNFPKMAAKHYALSLRPMHMKSTCTSNDSTYITLFFSKI